MDGDFPSSSSKLRPVFPSIQSLLGTIADDEQALPADNNDYFTNPGCLLMSAQYLNQHRELGDDILRVVAPSNCFPMFGTHYSQCKCVIDLSTPESLQRDFYAWLHGAQKMSSRACSVHNTLTISADLEEQLIRMDSASPGTSHCSEVSSSSFASSTATHEQSISTTKQRTRRKRTVDKGRGTNLYGRPYCPGRPLSMDERCQIISLFQAGMKVNAISKQLCISHGCVSKIITRFRETGLLIPSSHAECRRRKRLQLQAVVEHIG